MSWRPASEMDVDRIYRTEPPRESRLGHATATEGCYIPLPTSHTSTDQWAVTGGQAVNPCWPLYTGLPELKCWPMVYRVCVCVISYIYPAAAEATAAVILHIFCFPSPSDSPPSLNRRKKDDTRKRKYIQDKGKTKENTPPPPPKGRSGPRGLLGRPGRAS